ncbi:MAG: type II toxin-antitoxin system VapC family toxin [Candidatus Binataceae bacterium]
MYLLDTNVISEIQKGSRCDSRVSRWYETVQPEDLYLSALVIGEIRQGIERLRRRDARRARVYEDWLDDLRQNFAERVLPVDTKVAEQWGRIIARETFPIIDSLLAATAAAHGFYLVTRNLKDIERARVRCLNPFEYDG